MQYLRKGGMKLTFLHADKHQVILKVNATDLGGHSQAPAKITQNNKFRKYFQYLKKKVRNVIMNLIFCADEYHSYL